MTTEQQPKQKTQAELNIELQQAVNEKISSQRNTAHTRIAHLELILESGLNSRSIRVSKDFLHIFH